MSFDQSFVVPRLQALARILAPGYAAAVSILAGILVFGTVMDVHVADLTRDPAAVLKGPIYAGALSNLGILVWSAAATVCFLGYRLHRRKDGERSSFFLASGIITTVLLIDDLFLVHETVFARCLGVPEEAVYAAYGVLVIAYLARFASRIAETEWGILFIAFGWFSLSIVLDILPFHSPAKFFLEDSCKFLGIVTWSTYFGMVFLR